MSDWMSRHKIFEEQAAGMHPEMTIEDFNYTIKISPKYNYAYAVTPKAGCTTLQKMLIDAEFGRPQTYTEIQYLHYREFHPFLKPMQIGDPKVFFAQVDLFKFCFVRHPYTRLLSAYLDKIVRKKPQADPVIAALNKEPSDEITFAEFVHFACDQPVIEQDHHWRVQYYLTYQASIEYDFVGRFENLTEDIKTVMNRLSLSEFIDPTLLVNQPGNGIGQHHATNANNQLETYYTPELREKVRQKYAKDFEYFGYA